MNKTLIPAIAAIVIASPVTADDLSCGSDLVQPGDSIESLLQKCGDPDEKQDTFWVYTDANGNRYQVNLSQGTVSEIKDLSD